MTTGRIDRPPAGRYTALLVSADHQLFDELRTLLSHEGMELVARCMPNVADTTAAMLNPFDLVVVDIRSGTSDHLLLLAEIGRFKSVGVLAVCARQPIWTEAIHLSSVISAGASDVIFWPSSKGIFRVRVRELLQLVVDTRLSVGTPPAKQLKPSIALVDDESNILTSLRYALQVEDFSIRTYSDGLSALDGLTKEVADLGVFDIKMPFMDGMELLRRLRQQSDMPVIFLTSKDEEIDELFGLKMGADDYIAKPFSQRLVVERIKSVLRRCQPNRQWTRTAKVAGMFERGRLRLDPQCHTCHWDNKSINLTETEFLILQTLASQPGVVRTRDALMGAAFDDQVCVDDRTIDSHVKRLRKKFKQVDSSFDSIETLYGVGYRFQ